MKDPQERIAELELQVERLNNERDMIERLLNTPNLTPAQLRRRISRVLQGLDPEGD